MAPAKFPGDYPGAVAATSGTRSTSSGAIYRRVALKKMFFPSVRASTIIIIIGTACIRFNCVTPSTSGPDFRSNLRGQIRRSRIRRSRRRRRRRRFPKYITAQDYRQRLVVVVV